MCLCENCPEVPDGDSRCCFYETKVKEICSKEGALCITNVGKMAKILDKVKYEEKKQTSITLNLW